MTAAVVALSITTSLLAMLLTGAVWLWAIANDQGERLREQLAEVRRLHQQPPPSTLYRETIR